MLTGADPRRGRTSVLAARLQRATFLPFRRNDLTGCSSGSSGSACGFGGRLTCRSVRSGPGRRLWVGQLPSKKNLLAVLDCLRFPPQGQPVGIAERFEVDNDLSEFLVTVKLLLNH